MFKLKAFDDPLDLNTKILFVDEENRTIFNFYTGEAKMIQPGEALKAEDFMKVPMNMVDDFLKACANFIDQKGIKTKSEFTLEGELKATEKHLADLRQLLKLK